MVYLKGIFLGILAIWAVLFEAGADLSKQMNFHRCPGKHTIKSPVVGKRAHELRRVRAKRKQQAILVELEKASYKSEMIYLIPLDKKDEADLVARRLFQEYISQYAPAGLHEQNAVNWIQTETPGLVSNKTFINEIENEWNTWSVEAFVEQRHEDKNEKHGGYLPPHVVAYHELMHVEETEPKQSKKDFPRGWSGCELLTALKTIILVDQVYKEIHGLDLDQEVEYGKEVVLGQRKLSLGHFANHYRQLEQRYGCLADAVLSEESIRWLERPPALLVRSPS